MRSKGSRADELKFTRTHKSLFQQRWVSKAVVRAYHGDYINEKIFKRWYLPETLPDVRPRRKVLGDDSTDLEAFALRKKKEKALEEEVEKKGMAPVGSLMFSEVERRIDVFIFRCCFVHSVYEARRLVIHGDVMLNGKKVRQTAISEVDLRVNDILASKRQYPSCTWGHGVRKPRRYSVLQDTDWRARHTAP